MNGRTPPNPTARLVYEPQPGVVTILSDNPPRSLAMVTSWGFRRLPAAQPGEWARCKHPADERYAVIVDDSAVDLVLAAEVQQ